MKINTLIRKLTFALLISCFSFSAFAEIEINDEAGLKAIANNLAGSYKLMNNITLTEDWTPLGEFTGILDGNGHVISGLKLSVSGSAKGFFSKMTNASISRLGFENAQIKPGNTSGNTQIGVIVGDMYGGSISECYVANSVIVGYEHLGSIAGRINRGATIENCYASAVIKGNKQSGGIVGVLRNSTVSKCYFSGMVSTDTRRSNGIVGLVDPDESGQSGSKTIEYCVNLAPYLFVADGNAYGYSNNYHFRIADGSNNAVMTSNYSLSASKLGKSLTDCKTVVTNEVEYGANKKHGANLPNDSDAKSAAFYTETLAWDFDDTWQLLGNAYPVLKWQTSPMSSAILNLETAYSLSGDKIIDLNGLLSAHGLDLTFSTESNKIKIENGMVSLNSQIIMLEDVYVKVSGGSDFVIADIPISLIPSGTISISALEELLLINLVPDLDFELKNDIDLTGLAFEGLCTSSAPFTGTFDGKGHIIKGLSCYKTGVNSVGFFRSTNGAIIKNTGFENANVVANNQAGVIVGDMYGGSISGCYVANSSVTGNEHLGAIAGRINRNAVVENSYATAVVNGEKQSGGVVGVLRNSKVSKCYFSGIVSTATRRANGIVGLVDPNESGQTGAKTIEYCVNLAPYLFVADDNAYGYSNSYHFRIVDEGSNGATLTSNYSLAASLLGKSMTDCKLVPTNDSNYGASKKHGANLPSDSDAKSSTFYANTLGWDFTDTWKMLDDGYPVLKWQTIPVKFSILKNLENYTLTEGIEVNINNLISTHGLDLSFASESEKITIVGNKIAMNGPIEASENVVVKILATDNFECLDSIKIKLLSGSGVLSIETPEDLLDVSLYPNLAFILKNDIDMEGIDFTPLGTQAMPFTGTFDGAGYVIRNLLYENSSTDCVGLFGYTNGADIKNLGIEGSRFVGKTNVGAIAGYMNAGTIEQSYVSNTYVGGTENVGGISGTIYEAGAIKNTFSVAEVQASATSAGGIAGSLNNGHIENCYFSGTVTARDRSGGIVALLNVNESNAALNSIKNCVNLSLEIKGATQYPQRIIWTFGRAITLSNNYSLSETLLSKGSEQYKIDESESYYGAENQDGANIPGGDVRTKANPFYETVLNWNFEDVWTFDRNFEYPILNLFSTEPVTREDEPSELNENNMLDVIITVSGNTLFLENLLPDSSLSIYTASGQRIFSNNVSGYFSFELPQKGFYIVSVEENGNRFVVKVLST